MLPGGELKYNQKEMFSQRSVSQGKTHPSMNLRETSAKSCHHFIPFGRNTKVVLYIGSTHEQ